MPPEPFIRCIASGKVLNSLCPFPPLKNQNNNNYPHKTGIRLNVNIEIKHLKTCLARGRLSE